MELANLGCFIRLYEHYYTTKGNQPISTAMINLVKSLRNGCAHNNCIIVNLNPGGPIAPAEIMGAIKTMTNIN